ncbi:hypothetical protein Cpir12675_003252 [Ceratocystis pirilliformis]|uniref:Transcription initiation factor TFIID subunit 4 n=1 Tax=Ceratocystis pirilliformis TaxID=259994 RepID=A0ABR3Z4Z6_9PEZI
MPQQSTPTPISHSSVGTPQSVPSPSPISQQTGFTIPPNKRQRLSPPASQPESPYKTHSYISSPASITTPTVVASPKSGGIALPMATAATTFATPQQSSLMASSLHLPEGAASPTLAMAQAQQRPLIAAPSPSPVYTTSTMVPIPVLSPAPVSPVIMTPDPMTPGVSTPTQQQQLQHQVLLQQQQQQQLLQAHQQQLQQQQQQQQQQQPQPQQAQTVFQAVLPGVMAPPARPAEKTGKEKDEDYDPTDSLAGTGIDIKAEEAYMASLYAISDENKNTFSHLPPGSRSTMYGSGPLNQPATQTALEQNLFAAQVSEKAWNGALLRWERSHVQELSNPFLLIANLHHRADKIARDQGLSLNLETKINPNLPKMKNAPDPIEPRLQVSTKVLPDSTAIVNVTGSFIPHEANLGDQMALLSLATKCRLKSLIEDADRITRNRQNYSHGEIPQEWQPAAAELKPFKGDVPIASDSVDADIGTQGPDSSHSAGQKRPVEATKPTENGPPSKIPKVSTNHIIQAVRETGRTEREWEERRLRRRNARLAGTTDTSTFQTRTGSVAPGAQSRSIAPDKKESGAKKEPKRGSKMAEASHASQNQTSSMFAGFGAASGLFGKKRKGKTYDWMNPGSGGGSGMGGRSGAATPGKSAGANAPATPAPLTSDTGRNRLGTWREDKDKGRLIQLRDWVAALTDDGLDSRAIQAALDKLDTSLPR